MNKVILWVAACALLFSGCARVKHVPVTDDSDKTETGIRYYNLSPYMLIYSKPNGGLSAEVKYLPDRTKKMAARPFAFLSKLETELNFSDGALTKAVDTGDATAVPSSILKAVSTVKMAAIAALDAGKRAAEEAGQEYTLPAPHLYKIVVKADSVTFIGGPGKVDIKVSMLSQDEESQKGGAK